jgi:nucleoside-diphosphate-sugar epimerase
MKVLFIGGTGVISSACVRQAVKQGFTVTLLNRQRSSRPIPPDVEQIQVDIHDQAAVAEALNGRRYDVVVDWIAFTPADIERDLALFRGQAGQYIFISSASAYQTPPQSLPVTESTPLHNPYWQYSRDKIACEERLWQAYVQDGFPLTIVRPSHTYDETMLPIHGGYTVVARMRQARPVVVHGDGTSLWTLTHHTDFAVGFTGLLGHPQAIGEAYHITSDEWLSWNQIYEMVASAAGAAVDLVHVPSDAIAALDPRWGASLLGDKAHSMIFDNSKVKRLVPQYQATVPFWRGAREIMTWYDADPARQKTDPELDRLLDKLVIRFR